MDENIQLRRHQEIMYELLLAFDTVCRKHDIPYMLFAGSALGAVRHNGFIPWDDDLDVLMLRPEYERFLAVAEQDLDAEKYFLQKEFTNHWPMYFSKLRKNNTACLERYVPKDWQTHLGVYIDIFPCDTLADNPLMRKLQYYASKVVVAKSLDQRGYLTDSMVKKTAMVLCRLLPRRPFASLVKHGWKKDSCMVHTFLGGGSRYAKSIYPRQWFTEMIQLPFESGVFPVSAHYDDMLTVLYGDYMTPLPEEKRGSKVHAELVDLDQSYINYQDWQKKSSFSEYTRSIR